MVLKQGDHCIYIYKFCLQNKEYAEALQWYDYSFNLFLAAESDRDPNMAKLHRNRASCYINMENLDRVWTIQINTSIKTSVYSFIHIHTCLVQWNLLLKDHPNGQKNMVSQDRWSLVTGSFTLKCRSFGQNQWSFKTGGLLWQRSLKTGFTIVVYI